MITVLPENRRYDFIDFMRNDVPKVGQSIGEMVQGYKLNKSAQGLAQQLGDPTLAPALGQLLKTHPEKLNDLLGQIHRQKANQSALDQLQGKSSGGSPSTGFSAQSQQDPYGEQRVAQEQTGQQESEGTVPNQQGQGSMSFGDTESYLKTLHDVGRGDSDYAKGSRETAKQIENAPFRKTYMNALAKDLNAQVQAISPTLQQGENIEHMKGLLNEGFFAPPWLGGGRAADMEASGVQAIEPVLKLLNPRGTLPIAKIKLSLEKYVPKWYDTHDVAQRKLARLEAFHNRGVQYAKGLQQLAAKHGGPTNIPPSVYDNYRAQGEAILQKAADEADRLGKESEKARMKAEKEGKTAPKERPPLKEVFS